MKGNMRYAFSARPWQHAAPGGWYFVSLPRDLAGEIRQFLKAEEQGWGRLPATVKVGQSEWETAIWFDTKQQTYLLPLKAVIRKKEHIGTEQTMDFVIWL